MVHTVQHKSCTEKEKNELGLDFNPFSSAEKQKHSHVLHSTQLSLHSTHPYHVRNSRSQKVTLFLNLSDQSVNEGAVGLCL